MPLALLVTLYTNPFIVPLYVLAYQIGRIATGDQAGFVDPPALDITRFVTWMTMRTWMIGVGKPLAVGLVLLAATLALAGYMLTKAVWRDVADPRLAPTPGTLNPLPFSPCVPWPPDRE